ncbi:MAG: RNA-binding protein [Reyranellaceae bacterium]
MQRIGIMDEGAPDADAADAGPLRRCIATERSLAPERLIRFVVAPDGTLTPDIERRLPGRGLWVAAEKAALDKAVAKNLFARAARRAIAVPADLPQRLQALLLQRLLDTLGLARRAGQAVAGHDKVQEFLVRNGAGALLLASDAGKDARGRIGGLARGAAVIEALDAAELGAAFGREQAVFAVVAPGRLAQRLTMDAARLQGLRGLPTAPREQV